MSRMSKYCRAPFRAWAARVSRRRTAGRTTVIDTAGRFELTSATRPGRRPSGGVVARGQRCDGTWPALLPTESLSSALAAAVDSPVTVHNPGGAAGDAGPASWQAPADIQHREIRMTCITTIGNQLRETRSLAAVLDTAYDGFEKIMSAIRRHQDSDTGMFAALVFAAAAAADGRDAVAVAPSLPPGQPSGQPAAGEKPGSGGSAAEIADALAGLSMLIAARLEQAARSAADPGDRAACRDGAHYAREIGALLAGNGP